MSPEVLSGLIGAVVALIGAVAAFIARSGLSSVIRSSSSREETAVEKMAGLLESSATRDEKREERLLIIIDKSMETVNRLTQSVTQMALQLQGHEQSENLRWSQDIDSARRIQATLDDIQETIDGLEALIADLALKLLEERREFSVLQTKKGANTDENEN